MIINFVIMSTILECTLTHMKQSSLWKYIMWGITFALLKKFGKQYENHKTPLKISLNTLHSELSSELQNITYLGEIYSKASFQHVNCNIAFSNNDSRNAFIDLAYSGELLDGRFQIKLNPRGTKRVTLRGALPEVNHVEIETEVSKYGRVFNISDSKFPVSSCQNGIKHVELERPFINIPSQIGIKDTVIQVCYHGQKHTCFKCGETNHMVNACH